MEWIKKHTDTVIILTAVASSIIFMNTRFNEMDRNFSDVDREIAIIKTVLVMKNVMPVELATNKELEK